MIRKRNSLILISVVLAAGYGALASASPVQALSSGGAARVLTGSAPVLMGATLVVESVTCGP